MLIGKKRKFNALSPPTVSTISLSSGSFTKNQINLEMKGNRTDFVLQELDKIHHEDGATKVNGNLNAANGVSVFKEETGILTCPLNLNQFHRFEVLSAEKQQHNKILFLKLCHFSTHQEYNCELSGQWTHSNIIPNDIVHLQSNRFESGTFYIDNQQGFITINPDIMVTSTLLSSSVFCMRKAWLGEQFKGWGFGNKYMLVGTIVHTLFQKACTTNVKTSDELDDLLLQIAGQKSTIMECFVSEITVDQLITEVRVYIPSIVQWLDKYVLTGPGPLEDEPDNHVKVISVHDIEDNIWCPAFGSKGKIDVTLEVELHSNLGSKRKAVLPLELKTGRPSFSVEHVGQIALYSMMMSNRDTNEGDGGLLLYLKDAPRMKLNQIKRPVSTSLLQRRNELAFHLNKPLIGPTPKDSMHSCGKCEHLLDCSLMLRSFEPETLLETRVMNDELVPNVLAHLSEQDISFFKHWIHLIQLEMSENKRLGNELAFWSELSETREAKGYGLGNLIIHNMSPTSVVLRRKSGLEAQPLTLHCSNLTGERVAVSLNENVTHSVPSKVAISIGFVIRFDSDEVEVSIERPVKKLDTKLTFRIDLLKYSQTYSTNCDNILRLMSDDDHCKRLRDLVVNDSTARYRSKYSRSIVEIAKRIIKPLNEQQQRAVLKVINTEDYLLIRGTPGSGKTSVIVAIVRMLIEMGKSILITSHTHAAVDNILLKLKEYNIDFVRIGSDFRIHPTLKDFSMTFKTKEIKSPEELKKFYSSIKVVAVTCLGVNSEPLFGYKKFDYCLIDEASQVLLPTTLGPLFASEKFILVGDEKQLPPVVRSRAAKEGGLERSLFSRLLSKESSSLQLAIQYRMNSEIVTIPSKLFYNDALKCGDEKVAKAVLPGPENIETGLRWLDQVLSCHISKSFLFLNTDKLSIEENEYSGLIENSIEADLIHFIVEQFIKHLGLSCTQMGVISPFQKQVSLIKRKLEPMDIFVNSVDQFQGKEKDCILISCVKQSHDSSNLTVTNEEILSDERRINVAITRASKKCVIIGSRSTLQLYEPISRLFKLLRTDQIIELPVNPYPKINL